MGFWEEDSVLERDAAPGGQVGARDKPWRRASEPGCSEEQAEELRNERRWEALTWEREVAVPWDPAWLAPLPHPVGPTQPTQRKQCLLLLWPFYYY